MFRFIAALALSAAPAFAQETGAPVPAAPSAAPVAETAAETATESAAAEAGELAFNNHCRTCHSLAEGDNRLGPSLHGVVGRTAGAVEGVTYSPALAQADFAWDAAMLDAFLADPDATVPGHGMKPFAGLADAEVRAAIIAHLGG